MKSNQLMGIIKSKNIVIPLYLYKEFDKFNIDFDSFILLMYLYNNGIKTVFNPQVIMDDLGLDLTKVMEYISKLTDAKLIELKVEKNDHDVMDEYINLEPFCEKVLLIFMDENNNIKDDSNIFSRIESEFGRTLSSIECELVRAWLENNTSEELIEEALKEATLNGVSNLRYMDKIIYEWTKKGIKNRSDVEKNRTEYRNNKSKEKPKVFEYNWLDDEDE